MLQSQSTIQWPENVCLNRRPLRESTYRIWILPNLQTPMRISKIGLWRPMNGSVSSPWKALASVLKTPLILFSAVTKYQMVTPEWNQTWQFWHGPVWSPIVGSGRYSYICQSELASLFPSIFADASLTFHSAKVFNRTRGNQPFFALSAYSFKTAVTDQKDAYTILYLLDGISNNLSVVAATGKTEESKNLKVDERHEKGYVLWELNCGWYLSCWFAWTTPLNKQWISASSRISSHMGVSKWLFSI